MIKPPKNSIFDITLPGTPAPYPEPTPEPTPALQADAFQTAKVPIPAKPKTSIFDVTLTDIPAAPPFTPSLAPAIPPPPVAPEVAPEADTWDEGTAAEWNPKWNPKPAPLPKPEPAASAQSGLRAALLVAGLVACTAVIAAGVLYFRNPATVNARSHTKVVPPALQGYLTRAEAGDPGAMRMLGLCYCYGIAAPADWQEGVLWLRRAAKAGNATARTELTSMGVRLD